MYKVSVVIPICNVEDYARACIESVMKQTMREVEIICVDDASKDNSLAIIREYAEKDERIKVIAYDTNKSASQARKDGALLAQGEYIMFLDGDDYLEKDACEKLYSVIKEKKVDMVHFGTNIINAGYVQEKRIENLAKMLEPYYDVLRGKDVFEGCFIDKKYRFSIWNKIYEAQFCKKAFQYVKDGNYPKAQDVYAFFILCYFAESYYGIEDKFYNYRFGTGITGNRVLTLPQLERYCQSELVAGEIQEFIKQQNEKYTDVALDMRKSLLNDCVSNWYTAVHEDETAQGFDILCKYWAPEELVSAICGKYYYYRRHLAQKILNANALKCEIKEEKKTIGIFYHRYSVGGVQRVISNLIPMYMKLGYKVVLFTDEIAEDEYKLPKGAERVVLPDSLELDKDEYMVRAKAFSDAVKEYGIDIMCYQAASSPKLLFDMLLLKLNNVPIIVTVHEVAFQSMLTMNLELTKRPAIYKLADYITVLSRVEERYWRSLGVNAVYLPNPITSKFVERDLTQVEKNTIVWVGRLDIRTKRCLDVVDIMKHVTVEIPDAKLLVVGNEVSPGIFDTMTKKIEKYHLEENVILCGHSTNVDQYYRKAEIYMLTSISESFSMTIAESKSYGLPLVMYELPFLELCRDKRGYLSAPQGDKKKMAENIVKILKDEEYKEKLQKEAQESLKDFLKVDVKEEWNKIFNALNNELPALETDETITIMLQSILQHYEYGTTINNNEKASLRKKVAALSPLRKIKHSWDYKLGHVILWAPHKIIWGLRKLKKKLRGAGK